MSANSDPNAAFSARFQISVALAAALSLWGTFEFFRSEADYQKQLRDPYAVAAQPVRLEGIRGATPETATLGYLTDAEPGSVVASAIFNGAQYALAPRLLEPGASHEWVLGNFTRPADFAAFGRTYGLRLERDLGNGVILFRKEASR